MNLNYATRASWSSPSASAPRRYEPEPTPLVEILDDLDRWDLEDEIAVRRGILDERTITSDGRAITEAKLEALRTEIELLERLQ